MPKRLNYQDYFRGKKITVIGLGLLGRGVGDVKFLAEGGADLIVTDLKSEKELSVSLKKLKPKIYNLKPITYHLGKHQLADFRNRDFILKAAGVPLDSPYIAEARKNKVPVEMSTALFARIALSEIEGLKIIGVTGTRGKSTTTHLIYEILKAGLNPEGVGRTIRGRIVLGGNVKGVSTLALLKKIKSGDVVVLELDSWQLQGFGEAKISPHIAVFTNFLPDHLNYYKGNMKKYYEDKANIFKYQKPGDYLIKGEEVKLPKDWQLKIPGEHNRQNAALAKKVGEIMKVKSEIIKKVITNFAGVSGRLELIRTWRGIKIYNDTTSTTPDALGAALKALNDGTPTSIILIAGGADKNLDFKNVLPLIKKYCREVVLLPGSGTDKVKSQMAKVKNTIQKSKLSEAFAEAVNLAKRGDAILFSPAFASFGLFANEFDRGEQFNRLVKKLK